LTKEDDGKHKSPERERGSMRDEIKDEVTTKIEETIFNIPESSRHS
jgi:hypothetical protein